MIATAKKMHTPTELHEACLIATTMATEQTAAHYEEKINNLKATIVEQNKQLTFWYPERMKSSKWEDTKRAQNEVLGSCDLIGCILKHASNRDKLQFVVTCKGLLTENDPSIGMQILKGPLWTKYQKLRIKWRNTYTDESDEIFEAMQAAQYEYIEDEDRRPREFVKMFGLVDHWNTMVELKQRKKDTIKLIKINKAKYNTTSNNSDWDESDDSEEE